MSSDSVDILTRQGRVLAAIIRNPDTTVKELAEELGCSEANIANSKHKLASAKLITRTKVDGKNRYSYNLESLQEHGDIDAVCLLALASYYV